MFCWSGLPFVLQLPVRLCQTPKKYVHFLLAAANCCCCIHVGVGVGSTVRAVVMKGDASNCLLLAIDQHSGA